MVDMMVMLKILISFLFFGWQCEVLGFQGPHAVRRCMTGDLSGVIMRRVDHHVIHLASTGSFHPEDRSGGTQNPVNDDNSNLEDGKGEEQISKGSNNEEYSINRDIRSSGLIFSDDFKQIRRKRGKFVSSRDRRRDRMINSRSRPSRFPTNQEDEISDDRLEMGVQHPTTLSSSPLSIANSVERSTDHPRTIKSTSGGHFRSHSTAKRTWAAPMPGDHRRGVTQESGSARVGLANPGEDLGTSSAKGKEQSHFRKDGDGSGSSYTISGKQTTLHANDVYCRFLHYDHLSPHSLDAIEVSSNRIPKHKNIAYISRWWRGAKKWGVLSEDLEEIERAHTNASTENMVSSSMTSHRDNDNFAVGDGGGGAAAAASETPSSRRIQKSMYDAIREHCGAYKARVICVGDVHGCADELQDLLRKVNYRPSDVVVLLGDLVAKGPRSSDVIQMAIDLNAISVRGNHDQEVIRRSVSWRSSVKQGKPSEKLKYNEHTRIAKELSPAQWTWLTELPYFIRSDDLAALFVHAGFQANLRLTDQDPWVMMTMRSLLPGLRASARCDFRFPWASLWKGPMTVYFGHDAARGLQVYNHAVGLDTGCVYGAELTAMILPNKELVAVRARKAYQDMRKSRSHKSLAATGPSSESNKTSQNNTIEVRL